MISGHYFNHHTNIYYYFSGYIGLAVAFYYLGHEGLVKAAIIAGFVMILQNVLAVAVLQFYSRDAGSRTSPAATLGSAMTNPVILFKLFGISASDFIPGLIILAAPSATLVYIMAEQIGGDPDLAVAAISTSTLVSGLTYGIWLSAV